MLWRFYGNSFAWEVQEGLVSSLQLNIKFHVPWYHLDGPRPEFEYEDFTALARAAMSVEIRRGSADDVLGNVSEYQKYLRTALGSEHSARASILRSHYDEQRTFVTIAMEEEEFATTLSSFVQYGGLSGEKYFVLKLTSLGMTRSTESKAPLPSREQFLNDEAVAFFDKPAVFDFHSGVPIPAIPDYDELLARQARETFS